MKNFGSAEIRTRGHCVRSVNATSVQPPNPMEVVFLAIVVRLRVKSTNNLKIDFLFQSLGRPQSVILTPSRMTPLPPPRPETTSPSSLTLSASTSNPALSASAATGSSPAPVPPPLPARNRLAQATVMILTEDGDPESPPPLPPPRQAMPLPAPPLAERKPGSSHQSPRRSQTSSGLVGHCLVLFLSSEL